MPGNRTQCHANEVRLLTWIVQQRHKRIALTKKRVIAKAQEWDTHLSRLTDNLGLSLKCPLNMSKSSRLFGLARKSFIQCPCNGHTHGNNTACETGTHKMTSMSQLDGCYQCCACSVAVVKWYGFVVQPPPPPRCGGLA